MTKKKNNPLIAEIYDKVINLGWGRNQVRRYLNVPEWEARKLINECKKIAGKRPKIRDKITPEIYTPISIYDILSEMKGRQEYREKLDPQDHGLEIEIYLEPGPDGFARLLFTGDWHFGNGWTDYEAIAYLFKYIEKNKINFGVMGDSIECFIRPIKGNWMPIFNQVANIDEQWNFAITTYKHFIESEILKFIVTGNHDSRPMMKDGIDITKLINFKIPIKRNRAVVTVHVGDVTYKGMLIHKSLKGRSMYNPVHPLTRELRENCPDADFIVGAHTHVPAGTDFAYTGKDIPLVVIGSMISDADYSLQAYGKDSFIKVPMLYFDARKRTSPIYMKGFYLDKVITINIEDYKNEH